MITIANRSYTTLPKPKACISGFHFYDLGYLTVLEVQGSKAKEFLQGQLSADINEVDETQMRQAALCNLKGRVQALMDILYCNECYKLILPHDLSEGSIKALDLAAKLSRVTLMQDTKQKLVGIIQNAPNAALPYPLPKAPFDVTCFDGNFCYALDNQCFILLCNEALKDSLPLEGSDSWHKEQLMQKRVEIYPESIGLFLPHRLDLHLKGYLNFNKGCYKGQEIIARMHYRATPKHALLVFCVACHEPLKIGMQILTEDKQAIGELIDFCPLDAHQYLAAISILKNHPDEVFFEGMKEKISIKKQIHN